MDVLNTVVIFGGTGFIGTHLTQHFLGMNMAQRIILVDLLPPRQASYCKRLEQGLRDGIVEFVQKDVRDSLDNVGLPESADLIVNLAAVHREPGHAPQEYYQTNVRGAENVCRYASSVGCSQILFTSSISPYGPTEEIKDESTLPVPETPYGGSKFVAEKIHQAWQSAGNGRKLLILRPGVVFGPGEGGNVTRLVKSVTKGYFVYVGNRSTRKAGGYVKELCHVALFGLELLSRTDQGVLLLNFGTDPIPTLEQYVDTIRKVQNIRRRPFEVPRSLLQGVSFVIYNSLRLLGIRTPLNPVRVRKLYRSTSIDPKGLRDLGYEWHYTLEAAFLDWRSECAEDFCGAHTSNKEDRC